MNNYEQQLKDASQERAMELLGRIKPFLAQYPQVDEWVRNELALVFLDGVRWQQDHRVQTPAATILEALDIERHRNDKDGKPPLTSRGRTCDEPKRRWTPQISKTQTHVAGLSPTELEIIILFCRSE